MFHKKLIIAGILFLFAGVIFSSCSQQTFSARKYQHLDYVRSGTSPLQTEPSGNNQSKELGLAMKSLSASATYEPLSEKQIDKISKTASPDALPFNSNHKKSIGEKKLKQVELFKNLTKSELKKLSPATGGQLKGLDSNLKLAIIFGVIGVVLIILGVVSGAFAIIGSISLVVGLIFLLLYLLQ
ncbi:MAG: hypothetical protein H0W62_06580 [Chitinophagales bacterium]|nr:hypothetical protein [Chitinophagales bacterium]